MAFIYQQGLAIVLVPASSKIAIGTFNGVCSISTWTVANSNLPRVYTFVQNLSDGQYLSAAPTSDTYYRLEMLGAGSCEYVVGTAPVLTNAPVNAANGLVLGYTDSSGVPGAATTTTPRGRAAIAASASSAVITNALCVATSTVLLNLKTVDATATRLTVVAAAGSFTVTANAGATGTTVFDYVIIN